MDSRDDFAGRILLRQCDSARSSAPIPPAELIVRGWESAFADTGSHAKGRSGRRRAGGREAWHSTDAQHERIRGRARTPRAEGALDPAGAGARFWFPRPQLSTHAQGSESVRADANGGRERQSSTPHHQGEPCSSSSLSRSEKMTVPTMRGCFPGAGDPATSERARCALASRNVSFRGSTGLYTQSSYPACFFTVDAPSAITAPGISASPSEDNLRYFNVLILGPSQSPYEGAVHTSCVLARRLSARVSRPLLPTLAVLS